MKKRVIAGALGECVHVAGVLRFLNLAEKAGWEIIYLGPAVPIDVFLAEIRKNKPDLVGVSYRLTPEIGEHLLAQFAEAAAEFYDQGVRFVFGGTPPVAEKASRLTFFEKVFDGSQTGEETLAFLRGETNQKQEPDYFPQYLIERIKWKAPYPLLRHHFGLPDLEETRQGIKTIASKKVLDVISLGIDQDAQVNFFHPERQNPLSKGAGGVPVRSPEDYSRLYQASRCGNYPLVRTYSGTDDFIPLAEMVLKTIHNAWGAIPLFWFNQMDGRGPWPLKSSIREHQKLMAWYGERSLPVELNEPHHWGMRDAPDNIFVAAAYLSAYNARAFGVKDYIAQLMFESPFGLSNLMDLAKMAAVLKMIDPLSSKDFRIWKQTRTGLLSFPQDLDSARAHLAASTYMQMAFKPQIIHVVSPCEAHHAATPPDVIEACKMVQNVVDTCLEGAPDLLADPRIQNRVDQLLGEANLILSAIRRTSTPGVDDPLLDPACLEHAVTSGILDAPQLRNNPFARGKIITRLVNGACLAVGPDGSPLPEKKRLDELALQLRNPYGK